jgi:predicted GNAT family acetyltransferase
LEAEGYQCWNKMIRQGWNGLFSSFLAHNSVESKIAQGPDIMAEHEYRNAKNAAVVHNPSKRRFEINIDGQLSMLEYTFKNHRLFLTHTEVPPALESQGLGTELAHAALEYARQNELTVVAICPFVQEYVSSHPEYQSFVTASVA